MGKPKPENMSQFDENTKRKALEWDANCNNWRSGSTQALAVRAYEGGRNSAKESLEILARALTSLLKSEDFGNPCTDKFIEDKIAAVKQRGDWPL